MINIESPPTTWLDLLPTEIIFMIFNYLSNNDILYTFFLSNQRFNNLLLYNQTYLNYFELSTLTNFNTWKDILSRIGSRIKSLNIKIIYFSIPFQYFSNLKSLIISSSYGLADEDLKSLIENELFQNLESLIIKQDRTFSDHFHHYNVYNNNHDIFKESVYQLVDNLSNIKLKQLHLTLHSRNDASDKMDQLQDFIRIFSSSLICLSLNLLHLFKRSK